MRIEDGLLHIGVFSWEGKNFQQGKPRNSVVFSEIMFTLESFCGNIKFNICYYISSKTVSEEVKVWIESCREF